LFIFFIDLQGPACVCKYKQEQKTAPIV